MNKHRENRVKIGSWGSFVRRTLVLTAAFGSLCSSLRAQSTVYTNGETNSGTLTTASSITLTITSGAAIQSGIISGSGAVVVNASSGDTGTLTLQATNTYAGSTTVDFGTLAVSGTGASIGTSSSSVYIGENSGDNATLLISNGGTVTDLTGKIAYSSGTGTVTVTGSGSSWGSTGNLTVGEDGSAVLIITNSGSVSNADAHIGDDYGGVGSVTVTGAGSKWTNNGNLYVGYGTGSTGTLTISSGGVVSGTNVLIGYESGTSGSVTVTGPGSQLNISNEIIVGDLSNGTLMIDNGATVTDTFALVGGASAITGNVTVDGTGSTWNTNNILVVGNGGNALVTVSNSATISATTTAITAAPGTQVSMNLDSGGVLATGQVTTSGATVALNFDGGILRATGTNTNFISNFTGTEVNIESGGGTIDNNGYDITINAPLTGTGSLTFTGSGTATTILTGTNTYSGGTTVASGLLQVNTDTALSTGAVTVDSGATLSLYDAVTLNNNITISGTGSTGQGAIYSTGTDISGQTINGTVSLAADATVGNDDTGSYDLTLGKINLSTHTLTVGTGSGFFQLSGSISGSGGLIFNTTDGVNINGGNNTFTGTSDVLSGTELDLNDSGGTAISGDLTIESGASVVANLNNQFSPNTVVTINGNGGLYIQVEFSSLSETIAGLQGTSSSAVVFSDNPNPSANSASLTLDGSGSYSYAGAIKDMSTAPLSLTMAGTGIQTLTGTNTYRGGTVIESGTLAISGTGATIGNFSSNVTIDQNSGDNGTLIISNGGRVYDSAGTIGGTLDSVGHVIVNGAGSTWANGSSLYAGSSGTATLSITNGGLVSDYSGYVGNGGTGTVTVSGPGSTWNNNGGYISLGDGGVGTLIITNGGTVTEDSGAYVGGYEGSASITVDGTGSAWIINGIYASDATQIGVYGTATLTITNGGLVSSASSITYLTSYFGGSSTTTVAGAGSTFDVSGTFEVGYADTATLTVSAGGTLNVTGTMTDINNGSTVTVDGAGSIFTNSGDLYVGDYGNGALSITNGGSLTMSGTGTAYIGTQSATSGTVTVDGAGSNLATSHLSIGESGTGTLAITNGGKVTLTGTGSTIALGDSGVSTVTVDGAGSNLNASGVSIYMAANGGSSTLTISNGGSVESLQGVIGGMGSASVTVDGTGSTWTNTKGIFVGDLNSSTLTISNNGTVSGSVIYLASHLTGAGAVNLDSGGTLAVGQVISGPGIASLNFDGGILRATGTSTDFISNFAGTEVNIESGGGTIDNGGYNITINSPLTGTGSLTFTGTATTTLTATNTYAGGTNIDAGTVSINADNNLGALSGALSFNGGTLETTAAISTTRDVVLTGSGTFQTDTGTLALSTGITGTGGLSKTGAGTLLLTGTSTYAGNTTIDKGTLEVSGTNAAINTPGSIIYVGYNSNDHGSLLVANGGTVSGTYAVVGGGGQDSVTVDGTGSAWNTSGLVFIGVGGTGSLTVSNSGTVTALALLLSLSGTGPNTVNLDSGGVLESQGIYNSGTVGSAVNFNGGILRATGTLVDLISGFTGTEVTIQSGGGTIDNNGYDVTVSSPLAGTGSLTFTGTASTTLSGTNTYSGGTVLAGGTLVLANNSALGTGALITQDPTVAYLDGITIANPIIMEATTALEVDNSDIATQSGSISENGGSYGIDKVGTGTLILTAANTYSGTTTISAGTLAVGNSSALGTGDVINNSVLTTSGTTGVTINIGGNYTQSGTATLALNIYSASNYDSVNLTNLGGVATLNGTLALNLVGSFTPGQGQSYAMITTNNTISGTFSSVLTNLPSIGLKVDYTNDVTVLYQKPFVGLPGVNLTPNQTSVATYIDTYDMTSTNPGFNNLVGALNGISGDSQGLAGSFNQLTALNFANFASSTAFNNASFLTQQFDSYLANHRGADGGFVSSPGGLDYSGLTINDPNIDPALQSTRSRLLAWSPAPNVGLLSDSSSLVTGGTDMKEMTAPAANENRWNAFINGSVVLAQDFSQPSAGLPYNSATTAATEIGVDMRVTHTWLVGAAFGYGHTHANLDSIGSNATVNTFSPAIYTSYANNGWYYNAIASYGFANYSQQRNVSIPGFGGTASSSPNGHQIVGNLDGGYDFHSGPWTFGPTIGLQYVHLNVDGYSETGLPGADLTVNQDSSDSLRSRLGGQVSYTIKTASLLFTPHLSASWQHEFMDQSRGITSQFNAIGAGSFVVNTPNPSRDSALIDVGLDMQVNNRVTVFTDYSAQVGQSNYFGQSVQAGVKIGF